MSDCFADAFFFLALLNGNDTRHGRTLELNRLDRHTAPQSSGLARRNPKICVNTLKYDRRASPSAPWAAGSGASALAQTRAMGSIIPMPPGPRIVQSGIAGPDWPPCGIPDWRPPSQKVCLPKHRERFRHPCRNPDWRPLSPAGEPAAIFFGGGDQTSTAAVDPSTG